MDVQTAYQLLSADSLLINRSVCVCFVCVLWQVDRNELQAAGEQFTQRLGDLNKQILEEAGHEFNINSTQQLAHVLFDELRIKPPGRRSKSGNYSTGSEVLKKLSEDGMRWAGVVGWLSFSRYVSLSLSLCV